VAGPRDIRIGVAEKADIAAVAALYAASFEDPWPVTSIENLLMPPGCWALLAELAEGEVYHPAGFALVRIAADEAEILSIGVAPQFRRRGVAEALLGAFLEQAAGTAAAVYLEVGTDNPAAEALYRKLGFVVTGRRRNYYLRADRSRADALIMKYEL
jgi:ribosomal-protein-alanine N-acetyltransferase